MMAIALELAQHNPSYEDIASKFFEHFLYIADAINNVEGTESGLWDETDGFYYDQVITRRGRRFPMKVRSVVGILPMLAVETIPEELLQRLPNFKRRLKWFIANRPDLQRNISSMETQIGHRRLLSIVDADRLRRLLKVLLDENEFLSPHGFRTLSRYHVDNPYVINFYGQEFRIDYDPAESRSGLFGGNSNWRGPVWFPINFLLIEALQNFHFYYGDAFQVEFPTGSGNFTNLWEVASNLSDRLVRIFTVDGDGRRPFNGGVEKFQRDPYFKDLLLFNEYFHGDNAAGIGASHQTGWTGLVAKLIQQMSEYEGAGRSPLEWSYDATPSADPAPSR
jgi:hypothetical protein